MYDTQTPPAARQRFIKTLDGCRTRLSSDPDLRLTDFCKEQHTDYRKLIDWMSKHHVSVRSLKAEARDGKPGKKAAIKARGNNSARHKEYFDPETITRK